MKLIIISCSENIIIILYNYQKKKLVNKKK